MKTAFRPRLENLGKRAKLRLAGAAALGLALGGIALAHVPPVATALASGRDFFRFETAEDFRSGESDGVSVGPESRVRLAPSLLSRHDAAQPFIWTVAGDGNGGGVAGGSGAEGLLRFGGGAVTPLADTGDESVHAAAVGADGAVYFAASPNGPIQRIAPGGERSVLHDPEARYVWALVPEPGGSLLAATGLPGAVLRIGPSGGVETLFDAREENVTALHRGDDGAIHVGVEPSGIVFRIGPDGDAIALYDTPQAEIRALVVDSEGDVFAAAVVESGAEATAGPADAQAPPPPSLGVPQVATSVAFRAFAGAGASIGRASPPGSGGPRSAVWRIAPSGAATAIWESAQERPLSLLLQRDGRLLLGTGDAGRIYRLARDGELTLLARADAEQVTALAASADATLVATSNPGRILALAATPRTEGTYRSRVLDAGGAARFGRIVWEARTPPGTALTIETRSGNSGAPDDTWSDWAPATSGEVAPSPSARFLRWRAILRSDGVSSPELTSLAAAYLPHNLAPRVTAVTLHPPGRVFEAMLNPSAPRLRGMEGRPQTSEAERDNAGPSLAGNGRALYRPGVRTATFEAEDPNGDRLRYRISLRPLGEVAWRVLREGLREAVIAWETSSLPDGRYELRVEASDDPDNPPDEALGGSRVSRPFTVDNTPPTVGGLRVGADGSIRFTVEDAGSPVRRAEVSVDGAEPRLLRPADGIADSRTEEYDGRIPDFPAGARAIVVRVEDDAGNRASQEAEVGR